MLNANKPDASDLPSTRQLLKSTGMAAVIASALLAIVVLPAEYGVDPTGAGSLLGLTEMGRIKVSLAAEAAAEAADETPALEVAADAPAPAAILQEPAPTAMPAPDSAANTPVASPATTTAPSQPVNAAFSDETTITLAPDEGYEIKLVMEKGATATYLWFTDGGKANFDTHGDGPGTDYHGYGKGSAERAEGALTAAFTGSHGWFWRNRTDGDLKITLRTSGSYSEIKVIE